MVSITKQLSAVAKQSSTVLREMTLRLGQAKDAAIEDKVRIRTELLTEAEVLVLEIRSQTNRLVDELLFIRSELQEFFAKRNS